MESFDISLLLLLFFIRFVCFCALCVHVNLADDTEELSAYVTFEIILANLK